MPSYFYTTYNMLNLLVLWLAMVHNNGDNCGQNYIHFLQSRELLPWGGILTKGKNLKAVGLEKQNLQI